MCVDRLMLSLVAGAVLLTSRVTGGIEVPGYVETVTRTPRAAGSANRESVR